MTDERTAPVASGVNRKELVDLLRKVGRERIADLATEIDRTQQFSQDLWDLLSDLGIVSLAFPESVGGVGGHMRHSS